MPSARSSWTTRAPCAGWPRRARPASSAGLTSTATVSCSDVAGPGGSAIREVNLRTGRRRTRARAHGAQLLGPSLLGRALLYVRLDRCGQRLILRRRGRTRVLLRRGPLAGSDVGFDPGHTSQGGMHPCPVLHGSRLMLWSTALSSRFAYVTAIAPAAGGARAAILRTRRRARSG